MSADDIRNRLEKYISAKDSSVDLKQGPIYDLMLQPIPDEIDLGAVNAAHLLSLYGRINDPSQVTSTELEAIAKNLRVSRVSGSKATTTIKLVLSSTPTANVTIPAGTAVCTADFKYVFVTDYAVTVTPDNAYAFYNSKTGRYEVLVSATAQNTGSGYNLPIGKVTTLVKGMSTVQAVTNTVAASGGTDSSDDVSFYNRIQTALNGMDPSSLSAYFNAIATKTAYRNFLLFVSAADRTKFKRRVVGNSYDVYVGEPSYATYVDEFSYASGPKSFTLKTGPATSIQYVMVNGTVLGTSDWTFVRDTSVEFSGSTAASNKVVISATLTNADTVSIYYTVNKNCVDIQQALDSLSPQGVSFVVREMKQVPVTITVALSVTQVSPTLLDTATELLSNMVNGGQMDSISAFDVQDTLVSSIPSVRAASITELRRKANTASKVQTIALSFDEIATLDTSNGDLTVTATT
jgi:hypothetical protein